MYRILLSVICFSFFLSTLLDAQTLSTEELAKRREKIEDIYRIQDTRTPHNSRLLSYLSDRDEVVRRHATNAFGSIQDTTILPLLISNLMDKNHEVQYAAAFAIGQTATRLSKKGKEELQHDLIWVRLDQVQSKNTEAGNRLIEEIGKFGTEEGLKDLMLRFGSDASSVNLPLVMSIARFAIRNIVRQEATRYLISIARRNDPVPWQVMYALQRIGNNDDIRNNIIDLIPLYRQQDPLVRMYYATLLGKIHDAPGAIAPLMTLAEFDTDWRVRVNALKALAMFPVGDRDDVADLFRRLIMDKQDYIGLLALEAVGHTNIKESGAGEAVNRLFSSIREMTENTNDGYLWYYQAAAANTLTRLTGKAAANSIHVSSRQNNLLQAALLQALGRTGDTTNSSTIESFVTSDQPVVVQSALYALNELTQRNSMVQAQVEKTYQYLLQRLQSTDVSIAATAAELLGDTLYLLVESVAPMIDRLSQLHVPYDIDAMQIFCSTLGKIGDTRATKTLEELLDTPDRSVAVAAATALESITGKSYIKNIPEWFQPLYTDFDFSYLATLPDTVEVKMETTLGDIHLQLYKNIAPFTVMSFVKLSTQKGFFRGLTFHRIVPNFVVQGGDPRGDGSGGPGYSIRSEFSPLTYGTGALGMASSGKDTEGSQFFITQSPQPHLDGKYTIFGQVISGMDVVNTLHVDDRILDVKVGE